jgi:large subunit ribosomal protein L35
MKQKTHSGAKKRFKITGSKKKIKVLGRKASARHLLVNKSKRQKKLQGVAFQMQKGDSKTIKKLLNV